MSPIVQTVFNGFLVWIDLPPYLEHPKVEFRRLLIADRISHLELNH